MSENYKIVRCDACGGEAARIRHVSRSYGHGDDLFIVEDVPVVSCPSCGASYMTAETLHGIERLRCHRHAVSEEKPVEVVNFSTSKPSEAA